MQQTCIDRRLNSRKTDVTAQQCTQWRVIQQRSWRTDEVATEYDRGKPVQTALQHRQTVAAKYLVASEVPPDPFQFGRGDPEAARLAGKHDGINGACRCTADHGKRIGTAWWQHLGKGF